MELIKFIGFFQFQADDLASEFSEIHITEQVEEEVVDPEVQDLRHQQAWENGQIDYKGRDKFEFIQERIVEAIGNGLRHPADVPAFLS